mmetsp:Transcript_4983/g.12117  ORF Transcript_4983/g.12117 Transcript_4983/m.12117 type:complete len:217 (+) Transcript_4983:74-724(+)
MASEFPLSLRPLLRPLCLQQLPKCQQCQRQECQLEGEVEGSRIDEQSERAGGAARAAGVGLTLRARCPPCRRRWWRRAQASPRGWRGRQHWRLALWEGWEERCVQGCQRAFGEVQASPPARVCRQNLGWFLRLGRRRRCHRGSKYRRDIRPSHYQGTAKVAKGFRPSNSIDGSGAFCVRDLRAQREACYRLTRPLCQTNRREQRIQWPRSHRWPLR